MSIHTLMFGWEYPPIHCGGLGVACQGLVQGLLRNGVRVTLVLPHPHAEDEENLAVRFPTETHCHAIKVQSMLQPYDNPDTVTLRLQHIPRQQCDIYGADMASAIATYTAMSVEMTRDLAPDVVHCHDWMTYEAGRLAAAHHRVPLVAHIHATELDRTHFRPNSWIMDFERRGLHAADRVITVSNYTKDILVREYGIPADRISVVHNGISPQHERPAPALTSERPKRHPLVLFLGRMVLQKGPRQFLDMAAHVHRIRPDIRFCMAGDGNLLPELIMYACERHLDDVVVFAGKVSSREARSLYAHADCFVMPSLSEPFGLVALEAVAHGTPVILSKTSGVGEVLDHAFKVDFWDTEKMADCVLTILREQPLAQQLRSEAPRILQTLTWQRQANTVRGIYEHLLRNDAV